MFAPRLGLLRRRMYQRVFDDHSPEEFEDSETDGDDRTTSDTLEELGADELEELEEEFDRYIVTKPCSQTLEFNLDLELDPGPSDKYLITTRLLSSSPTTHHYIYHLHGLQDLLPRLKSYSESFPSLLDRCETLASAVTLEIDKVLSSTWDEWSQRRDRRAEINGVRVIVPTQRPLQAYMPPLTMSVLILTAIIHAIMGVSREDCNFILESLRGLLLMLSEMQDSHSDNFIRQNLGDIPTTLPTVLHHLDLPPTLALYVCCPKCSALYSEKLPQNVPECCTMTLDDGVCGEPLGSVQYRGTSRWVKPVRRYSHMLFENWLSELLMRPGIEDMLEAAHPSTRDTTTDVWDAPYLSSFPGQNEPNFFDFDRSSGELRLAMLLYHDFFNPYQNRTAGKVRSIGCFFMICLNLPPGVRYNASNAYLVSMVPGPHEAKLDELNIFIAPIVENMLEMYSPGIWISKTHKYPQGRKVRAAIAVKSLDTPAARGAGGFASHSHTCFCLWCTAVRATIDACDLRAFKPRTIQAHRQQVKHWVDAGSKKARSRQYDMHGVRHTDWLRFPWWDPFASMVVGPMHWSKNILEKQLRDNMAWSWTMDSGVPSDEVYAPGISQYEYDWGDAAMNTLSSHEFESAKLTAPLIRYLCCQRGLYSAGLAGPRLIEDLNRWRSSQGILSPDGTITPEVSAQYKGLPASIARARYHLAKPLSAAVIKANTSKSDLAYLCGMNDLLDQGEKEALIRVLIAHYSKIRVPSVPSIGSAKATLAVLGKQVLTEVRSDMERTTLPSWLKHPPKAFATLSHGKIQAEEYKSLAMVSFTITLVRLWGTQISGPYRDRLDHFLHLMVAVRILAFQSLIPSDITAFEHHYGEYLKMLKELYPDCSRTPVQHMGLHISTFLRSLGPSTRYSESTCELFNGMLQGIKTNFKFGDLELTMHREFVMAARLKGMIEQKGVTESLGTFGATIRRFLEQRIPSYEQQSTWRTTHSNDPLYLTDDTICALRGWATIRMTRTPSHRLFACRKLQRGNVIYAPSSSSPGNSCVLFCSPQQGTVMPGRIDFILEEPPDMNHALGVPRILLVVRPFVQLTPEDSFRDPYLNHPIIGRNGAAIVQLCYDSVETSAHIIEPKDLISHVALCTYDDPTGVISRACIVVVSLDLKHERFA